MKRRNFILGLLGLPLAGVAAKAVADIGVVPTKRIIPYYYDVSMVKTPTDHACFLNNGEEILSVFVDDRIQSPDTYVAVDGRIVFRNGFNICSPDKPVVITVNYFYRKDIVSTDLESQVRTIRNAVRCSTHTRASKAVMHINWVPIVGDTSLTDQVRRNCKVNV